MVLAGAPFDLFLFGQEPLELGVGLADHRRELVGRRRLLAGGRPGLGRRRAGLGLIGLIWITAIGFGLRRLDGTAPDRPNRWLPTGWIGRPGTDRTRSVASS